MVAWTKSGEGNISFIANARQYFVYPDHPRYNEIMEGLKQGADGSSLADLLDQGKAVSDYLDQNYSSEDGSVSVEYGRVFYTDEDGLKEECHGTLVDRLLSFMSEGLPFDPLINFLKKAMQNPSYEASQELYDFLQHKSLPICEDGDFLAYKAVKHDYMDKYKGVFDNTPGVLVRERRNRVDDNRKNGCSKGLHAGTLEYVNSYGHFIMDEDGQPSVSSDRCVIVKINPMNVVSVPLDCDCQKLRTCEYLVVKDFEGELDYHLATEEGEEWEEDELDDYDWEEVGDEPVEDIDDVVLSSSIQASDIKKGDIIQFDYYKNTDGWITSTLQMFSDASAFEVRTALVDETSPTYITTMLVKPEAHAGEFRNFKLNQMSNIRRIS